MKVIVIAFVAMALISVGAWWGLHQAGFSAADRGTSSTVRLD